MKTTITKRFVWVSLAVIVLISACVTINCIIQPKEVEPNSVFEVVVKLGPDVFDSATDYTLDNQIDAGFMGILMPAGWTIVDDEFEFHKNASDPDYVIDAWVFADADHAAALESKEAAPAGYKWWGGTTEAFDMHTFTGISMTIKIKTDGKEGDYTLKYTFGDKNDTQNMARYPWYQHAVSDPLPIKVKSGAGNEQLLFEGPSYDGSSSVNNPMDNLISVYPTITNDFVKVNNVPENAIVKVMNIAGQTIIEENSNFKHTFDLSNQSKGIYLISIEKNSSCKTFRIVLY